MDSPETTVKITREMLGEDPPIETFLIVVDNQQGVWPERYTRREAEVFFRALETMKYTFNLPIDIPRIPAT